MEFIVFDPDISKYEIIFMKGMGHIGIESINTKLVISSRAYGMEWVDR